MIQVDSPALWVESFLGRSKRRGVDSRDLFEFVQLALLPLSSGFCDRYEIAAKNDDARKNFVLECFQHPLESCDMPSHFRYYNDCL